MEEKSPRQIVDALRARQREAARRRREKYRAAGLKSVTLWVPNSVVNTAKARGCVPVAVIYAKPGVAPSPSFIWNGARYSKLTDGDGKEGA